MLRHPAVLSSLEEDFKALGLLGEEGIADETGPGASLPSPPQTAAPAGRPATNKTTNSRNVGALSDNPQELGGTGTDDAAGTPHQGHSQPPAGFPSMPTGGTTNPAPGGKPENSALPSDDSEDPLEKGGSQKSGGSKTTISGMPDSRRASGSGSVKFSGEAPPASQEEYELVGASAVAEAIHKARGGSPASAEESTKARAAREVQVESGTGPLASVASLIEDVNNIVASIDDSRRSESVKAFANIAIISEMLRRGFENYGNYLEDQDLVDTATALGKLAEEAGDIAKALDESPEEFDAAAVEEEFRSEMDALLQGLDLYSDVVESVDVAEGKDKEGDEGADEEEDDDEDEDDDKDEKKDKDKEESVAAKGKPLAEGAKRPFGKPKK